MKIIGSPLAVERLEEIVNYIAKDSPSSAVKWANSVFTKIESLEQFPYMGRVVPEINRNEIREILFKNYRIIYNVKGDAISILTVRHGKQLLPPEDLQN